MNPTSPRTAKPHVAKQVYHRLMGRLLGRLLSPLFSRPDWANAVYGWAMHGAYRPQTGDPRIQIGRHSYGVWQRTVFMARDEDRLTIGNFCSIADGVRFVFGNHSIDTVTTFPLRTILCEKSVRNVDAISGRPIIVGNDVWIATNAIILSGVTIGDGAVIGAGSVVTRDVAPYSLTAGTPARHIRFRFEKDQIEKLLQIRWWDWSDETILANSDALYGGVEAFTRRFSPSNQSQNSDVALQG